MFKRSLSTGALGLVLCIGLLPHARAATVMDCRALKPDSPAVLSQAPGGAERVSEHELLVHWRGGKHVFRDAGPHDVPLEGLHWHYCGYDATTQLHLIQKIAGEMTSGVVLDERTGRIVEAGQQILLADNGRLLLARRQQDSVDGEDWLLTRRNGRVLWRGPSFLTWPDGERRMADLTDPHWEGDSLTARLICTSDYLNPDAPVVRVRLQKAEKGYTWQPAITCAEPGAAL